MARTDHGEAARLQQSHVAAAIDDRRGVFAQAHLQAAGVLGIRAADHPDGARLPAFDDLTQKEASPKEALQTGLIDHGLTGPHEIGRIGRHEICGLALDLSQVAGEALVLARRQQILRRRAAPSDQGRRQQQDRLGVGGQGGRHSSYPV